MSNYLIKVASLCNAFFRKIQRLLFKKYPLKFSKLENQGPFILNEAMPDLMVVFLGWNSNFEKKVRGAYYYLLLLLLANHSYNIQYNV